MNRTSTVMLENHEDEQELEGNRWNEEEICRDQVLSVILEKGSPGLGGRFPVPDQYLATVACDTSIPIFRDSP